MGNNRWITPDSAPSGDFTCRLLMIPRDSQYVAVVAGALLDMSYPWFWEQLSGISADDAASAFQAILDTFQVERCVIGSIFAHALASTPANALACDGASYLRVDYPALYAVLAAAFITDADHFTVPDLRGRAVLGTGTGSGLTARSMNSSGGEETHQLTVAELAAHHHTHLSPAIAVNFAGAAATPLYVNAVAASTQDTGGGTAHNNMQPWRALSYAIIAK